MSRFIIHIASDHIECRWASCWNTLQASYLLPHLAYMQRRLVPTTDIRLTTATLHRIWIWMLVCPLQQQLLANQHIVLLKNGQESCLLDTYLFASSASIQARVYPPLSSSSSVWESEHKFEIHHLWSDHILWIQTDRQSAMQHSPGLDAKQAVRTHNQTKIFPNRITRKEKDWFGFRSPIPVVIAPPPPLPKDLRRRRRRSSRTKASSLQSHFWIPGGSGSSGTLWSHQIPPRRPREKNKR